MAVIQEARVETLSAVQRRLSTVLDDMQDLWAETAGRRADILGERDIPWLIRHAATGGKMIRPEMVHWGWVAAGAPPEAHGHVVDLGAAIELLHLFALIHDDVMDRSCLRRGQPTSHVLAQEAHERARAHGNSEAFGNAIAVLAGDLVHSEADHLVASLPQPVVAAWRRMMIELVLGQRRDLTGAAAGRRDIEHAVEVARLKSGAYTVAGPLRMGASLGNADCGLLTALDEYAFHAGEAFGLRDDVLGVWGNPPETGKSVDDDLVAGKATVLLAMAQERLTPRGQDLLERAGELRPADVEALRKEMETCGVREAVETLIADEVGLACAALDNSLVPEAAASGLTVLAHRLAWRTS